jgi:hypothetical protein
MKRNTPIKIANPGRWPVDFAKFSGPDTARFIGRVGD